MRPLGSGNTLFAILQKTMGAEFNEKLAEQKPVFSRDIRNDARRIARGEYPIYITQVFALASDLKGLPVKVVDPQGGRALRADGHGDAEGRAASERGAAVHATFPKRRIRNSLTQMAGCCRWCRRRPIRPTRMPSRSPMQN